MSYYKKVLEEHESLVKVLPAINVKFRDKVKFRGSSIEFGDFTKFVNYENQWLPVWYLPSDAVVEKKDIRDFTPLICVGMAEMLHTSAKITGDNLNYFNDLICSEGFSNMMSCLCFGKCISNLELTGESLTNFLLLSNLKFNRVSYLVPEMKRTVSLLYSMSELDRPLFVEDLFGLMTSCYAYCSQYYTPIEDLVGEGVWRDDNFNSMESSLPVSSLVNEEDLKCGAVKYKLPDSNRHHYISDGRGLGIYSFLILMSCLYDKHSMFSSDSLEIKLTYPNTKKYLQDAFESCFGDDVVRDIIKKGKVKDKNSLTYSSNSDLTSKRGQVCLNSDEVYQICDSYSLSRDIYEDYILFRKVYGADILGEKGYESFPLDFRYVNPSDVPSVLGVMFSTTNELALSKAWTDEDIVEYISDKSFRPTLRKVCADVGLSDNGVELIKLRKDLSDSEDKFKRLSDDYDKSCDTYQWQLNEKDSTIRKLREELDSLKTELSNMYSDVSDISDESEVVEEDDVSVDEMLDVLNSVNFGMVGGIDVIRNKLVNLGWNSVVWFGECGDLKGTSASLDFVCVHSKFCAHKIVYYVKDNYSWDTIMYFNGTNVDLLVKSCYNFVMKYMQG